MGLLFVLTRYFSLRLEIASAIAIEVSILSNFFLNNLWTFKKRDTPVPFWTRLLRYHLVTGLAGVVNYLVLALAGENFRPARHAFKPDRHPDRDLHQLFPEFSVDLESTVILTGLP